MDKNKWQSDYLKRRNNFYLLFTYDEEVRGSIELYSQDELKEFIDYVRGLQVNTRTDGQDRQDTSIT